MNKIVDKKLGIRHYEYWYADSLQDERGIISYIEAEKPLTNRAVPFRTLISNLRVTDKEILGKCEKNCRYKIRRAERESIQCQYVENEEITEDYLDKFCDFFLQFWESKNVDYDQKIRKVRKKLELLKREHMLGISEAILDDEVIVYHVYVLVQKTARLLYSASMYRNNEKKSSIIGFANRFLHYQDMLKLKKEGYETYDWGGAGLEESVANITEFKASFGGEPTIYYNDVIYNGILPKMYQILLNLYNCVRGKM